MATFTSCRCRSACCHADDAKWICIRFAQHFDCIQLQSIVLGTTPTLFTLSGVGRLTSEQLIDILLCFLVRLIFKTLPRNMYTQSFRVNKQRRQTCPFRKALEVCTLINSDESISIKINFCPSHCCASFSRIEFALGVKVHTIYWCREKFQLIKDKKKCG